MIVHEQKSERPKGLCAIERVKRVENDDKHSRAERERAAVFSRRLRGSQTMKQKNLVAVVDSIALPVLNESLQDLLEAARLMKNFEVKWHSLSVERVALEMLSAKLCSLACQLDRFRGQAGIRSARILLAKKIEAHIINRYPSLSVAANELADERAGTGKKGQQHENASSGEQCNPDRL